MSQPKLCKACETVAHCTAHGCIPAREATPTLTMVRAYGGLRIFIPTQARCTADHPFAQLIGQDKLLILAGEYGAEEHFTLPKAQRAILAVRNARIAHAYANNKTARELAAEFHLYERQIERIVAAAGVTAPPDRRQGTLF